jgi:hypothetical protein
VRKSIDEKFYLCAFVPEALCQLNVNLSIFMSSKKKEKKNTTQKTRKVDLGLIYIYDIW